MSKDNNVLFLLGMHRSGTSLMANWLHHCGLKLGKDFVNTDVGNVTGYYEDEEFVKFHKRLLRANDTSQDIVFKEGKLTYTSSQLAEAKAIFETRNQNNSQWSWKDPRTCLFLDVWNEIAPNAKVLFVYRDYNEVVHSLIRRKAKAEKIRRNKLVGYYNILTKSKYEKKEYTSKLLKSWIKHNKSVLEYIENKNPEDVITLGSKDLSKSANDIFDLLVNKLGFDLTYQSIETIYDTKLMNKGVQTLEYDPAIKREADDLWNELESVTTKFKTLT